MIKVLSQNGLLCNKLKVTSYEKNKAERRDLIQMRIYAIYEKYSFQIVNGTNVKARIENYWKECFLIFQSSGVCSLWTELEANVFLMLIFKSIFLVSFF